MTAQLPHQTHHSGSHRTRAGPRAPPPQQHQHEGQQQQQQHHLQPNAPQQQRPTAEAERQRHPHANSNTLVEQRASSGGESNSAMRFHPYPSPKGGGGPPEPGTTPTTTMAMNADTANSTEGPLSSKGHPTMHAGKPRGKPLAPHHAHPHPQHPASGAGSSKQQQQQRGSHVGGDQHNSTAGAGDKRPPPRAEEERPFRSPKLYPSFHDEEGHLWYRNNPYGENPTVAMDSEGTGLGGTDAGFLLGSTAAAAAGAKRGGEAFTAGRRGGRESSKPINYCRHHLLGKCNRGAMCRFAHLKQHDVVLKVTRTPQGLRAAPQSIDILMGDSAERDDDLSGFALPPSTAPPLADGVWPSGNASVTSSPATTGSSKVMPSYAQTHPTQPRFSAGNITSSASVSAYHYLGRSVDNIQRSSSSSPPLSAVLSLPPSTTSNPSVHVHAPYATPSRSTGSRVRSNDPYVSPGGVLGDHDDPLVLFEQAFDDDCDDGEGRVHDDEAGYTDSGSVSPPLHGASAEEMTADEAGEFDTFHAIAAAAHQQQRYPTHGSVYPPPSGYRYAAPPSTYSASSGGYTAGPYDGSVGSSPRMQRTETLEFVDTMTTVPVPSGGSAHYNDTRNADSQGSADNSAAGGHSAASAVAVAAPPPPAPSSSHSGSLPASYHSSPSLGFQPSPPLVASWPSAIVGGGGDELLDLDNFSLPRAATATIAGAYHPRQQNTLVAQYSHRTPSTSPAPPPQQQQLTPQWFAASFPGAMTVVSQPPYSVLLPPAASGTSPCGWQGGQSSTNAPMLPPYLTGSSCEVLTSSDPPSRYMTPQVTAEEEAILKSLW